LPFSVRRRIAPIEPGTTNEALAPAVTARPPRYFRPETELEFLTRHGIPEELLRRAGRNATHHGTGLLPELFALGFGRERYWSMLADDLDLGFLKDLREASPLPHAATLSIDAVRLATSVLVRIGTETTLVTAPHQDEAALLRNRLETAPALAERIRVATPEAIRAFVVAHRHRALTHYAVHRLARVLPRHSAGPRISPGASGPAPLFAAALALALLAPVAALTLVGLYSTLFVNCSFWKLASAFRRLRPLRLEPIFDDRLPTYAVLVPLYREAAVVPDLVAHLAALDYPALCSNGTTARLPPTQPGVSDDRAYPGNLFGYTADEACQC
jgi:hypothetical protein